MKPGESERIFGFVRMKIHNNEQFALSDLFVPIICQKLLFIFQILFDFHYKFQFAQFLSLLFWFYVLVALMKLIFSIFLVFLSFLIFIVWIQIILDEC